MENLLNSINLLEEKLKNLKVQYDNNNRILNSLQKSQEELKNELKNIEIELEKLNELKLELKNAPKKLRESKIIGFKFLLFGLISTILVAVIVTPSLTLKSFLINLLAVLSATYIIGSFAFKDYNYIKLLIKENNIEDIEKEINEQEEAKKTNRKKYSENSAQIKLLSEKQNELHLQIHEISKVLNTDNLNKEKDFDKVEENTYQENNKQKKIGAKKPHSNK